MQVLHTTQFSDQRSNVSGGSKKAFGAIPSQPSTFLPGNARLCENYPQNKTQVFSLLTSLFYLYFHAVVSEYLTCIRDNHYPVCRLDIRQGGQGVCNRIRISKNWFQTGTGYGSIYPKRFYRHIEDSDVWKKLHIAQSLIYYLQKHLFRLLCHDSESVYGVISEP